jgi:hypothetical protein
MHQVQYTTVQLPCPTAARATAVRVTNAGAIAWGLASILLVTPLLAPLAGALPLQPPGLALGRAALGG